MEEVDDGIILLNDYDGIISWILTELHLLCLAIKRLDDYRQQGDSPTWNLQPCLLVRLLYNLQMKKKKD